MLSCNSDILIIHAAFKQKVCDGVNAIYLCSCCFFSFLVLLKAVVDLGHHEKSCNGQCAVIPPRIEGFIKDRDHGHTTYTVRSSAAMVYGQRT